MVKPKLIRAILIGGLLLPLGGCLFDEPDTYQQSVADPADLLYNQGLAALEAKDFGKAYKRFDALETQYPGTQWSEKALLLSAFSAYSGGQYDDAITQSQRFVSLYPNSKDTPYAAYIFANSQYSQIPDVTRDQERTGKALQAFQFIVEKYPTSEYADDAKFKIQVARDQLAAKEMEVGRYYMRQGNEVAAINRFKVVVQQFQQTRHIEEALGRLTEAYMTIGLMNEAQTAAAVLGHNYPDSQWYKDSYKLVTSKGLEPREDKGSWISRSFGGLIPL